MARRIAPQQLASTHSPSEPSCSITTISVRIHLQRNTLACLWILPRTRRSSAMRASLPELFLIPPRLDLALNRGFSARQHWVQGPEIVFHGQTSLHLHMYRADARELILQGDFEGENGRFRVDRVGRRLRPLRDLWAHLVHDGCWHSTPCLSTVFFTWSSCGARYKRSIWAQRPEVKGLEQRRVGNLIKVGGQVRRRKR